MTCPDCKHEHQGRTHCFYSTSRTDLCLCKGGSMAKDNSKDEHDDGPENVDGTAPETKAPIGLRVKGATIKEAEDGGAIGEATVTGPAVMSLVKLVGQAVHVETVSGSHTVAGHVRAVTIAEAKKGGAKVATVKVCGARNLDGLVGLQVRLKQAQGELPLAGEGAEGTEPEPDGPPWREEDAPSPRRRKGRGARAEAPPA